MISMLLLLFLFLWAEQTEIEKIKKYQTQIVIKQILLFLHVNQRDIHKYLHTYIRVAVKKSCNLKTCKKYKSSIEKATSWVWYQLMSTHGILPSIPSVNRECKFSIMWIILVVYPRGWILI